MDTQIDDESAYQCDECEKKDGVLSPLLKLYGEGIFFDGETWYCPNCGKVLYVD